jgi:hypothetical protein
MKGQKAIELCMPISWKRTIEQTDNAGDVTTDDATFTGSAGAPAAPRERNPEADRCRCRFTSLGEGIDTQSATGRLMLGILGSFAQFERERIRERIYAEPPEPRGRASASGGNGNISPAAIPIR